MMIETADSLNAPNALPEPSAPKIPKATGAGDRLDFDDIYNDPHLVVQVPYFTGMARGQTVRVTWENPRHTYHSAVETVGTPGPMNIPVPRLEVVDTIGHTVKVYYTVREAPGAPLISSRPLLLHVLPYVFDLLAPTISADQKTLSATYVGMVTGYTVRLRAGGKTVWDSDERKVQTGVTPTFTLPTDWLAANNGSQGLFNYSVYKSGSGNRLMFSKVLRQMIGEIITPELTIDSVKGSPSGAEIPNGGKTIETTFVFTGRASPNQKIELRDDGALKATITVSSTGVYSHTLAGQAAGLRQYRVKALYGSGQASAVRSLTVRDIENFESVPLIKLTTVGSYAIAGKLRLTFLKKINQDDFVYVGSTWESGSIRGRTLYAYMSFTTGSSISYQIDLINRTARRILFWAMGGNVTNPPAHFNLAYLDSSGRVLHTINRSFVFGGNLQQIDSGVLTNISSMRITVSGQVIIDEFEFL